MKVVLFCGGLGMRMRSLAPGAQSTSYYSEELPKPMVQVGGQRPLLWNVMRYYAHYGHKEFILCLGYRGDVIKDYFLKYNEYLTNDFVMEEGGARLNLKRGDIQDWKIHFVDTGINSNVGERLRRVRQYIGDDPYFLANYSDGLSDVPLPQYFDTFQQSGKTAGFVCVRPPQTSHVVDVSDSGSVTGIRHVREAGIWINGGYFILKNAIFDSMNEGEELVEQPFGRLIAQDKLFAYKYEGFWACIDTFKEKQMLDDMVARGNTPWRVWDNTQAAPAGA